MLKTIIQSADNITQQKKRSYSGNGPTNSIKNLNSFTLKY